jgi:hypothetical protein
VLTVLGRVGDEVEEALVDGDVGELELGELAPEPAHHVPHLGVVAPGHLVELLDALAAAERVGGALERQAADGGEPREGDPPRAEAVDPCQERARAVNEEVLVLGHRELREPARGQQEVVLEEVVGADADDVERAADDGGGAARAEPRAEALLVLLVVLHLLPQRDH